MACNSVYLGAEEPSPGFFNADIGHDFDEDGCLTCGPYAMKFFGVAFVIFSAPSS